MKTKREEWNKERQKGEKMGIRIEGERRKESLKRRQNERNEIKRDRNIRERMGKKAMERE